MSSQRSSDFQVSFPELDKPGSAYRYGRRMYAIHKNMNSVGCLLGHDGTMARYSDAVARRLREKEGSRSQSTLRATQMEGGELEMRKLKAQLREKEQEIVSLRRSMETSFDPVRSFSPPSKPQRRPPSQHPQDLNRSVELPQPIRRPTLKPFSHLSPPVPLSNDRTSFPSVHELARLPFFSQPKYTHKHPKMDLYNPITGLKRTSSQSRSPYYA